MSDLFDVSGKTALVTGGSRGIGMMIARGLVQAGARVIQVNLEPTPYSGIVGCALEGPAGELLPQLIME